MNSTVNEFVFLGRAEVGVDDDDDGAGVDTAGDDGADAAGDVRVLSTIHFNNSLR